MNGNHHVSDFRQRLAAKLISLLSALFLLMVLVSVSTGPALSDRSGGHDVTGRREGSRTWYFAEGCTRMGFEEWVCLFNPNPDAVTAVCSYMLGNGQVVVREESLPPESRTTINVSGIIEKDNDVSLSIEATRDILAERPMYFR